MRYSAQLRALLPFAFVPVILVVADIAATRTALKFLLLPPFGALTYLVFVNPGGIELNVRRVILAPTATAVWSWLLAGTLGDRPISVALAVVGTMLIMWLLRASMVVPPMALALLTLLLYQAVRWQVDYLISVFVFTLVLYAIHRLWIATVGEVREETA